LKGVVVGSKISKWKANGNFCGILIIIQVNLVSHGGFQRTKSYLIGSIWNLRKAKAGNKKKGNKYVVFHDEAVLFSMQYIDFEFQFKIYIPPLENKKAPRNSQGF
jgi:hypothetical protein